jgi:hypothetical protein
MDLFKRNLRVARKIFCVISCLQRFPSDSAFDLGHPMPWPSGFLYQM